MLSVIVLAVAVSTSPTGDSAFSVQESPAVPATWPAARLLSQTLVASAGGIGLGLVGFYVGCGIVSVGQGHCMRGEGSFSTLVWVGALGGLWQGLPLGTHLMGRAFGRPASYLASLAGSTLGWAAYGLYALALNQGGIYHSAPYVLGLALPVAGAVLGDALFPLPAGRGAAVQLLLAPRPGGGMAGVAGAF
jgi:hypothetical protein